MRPTHHPRGLLSVLPLLAALAACGGNDPTVETSVGTTETNVAASATEEAGPDQGPASTPAGADGGGEVTVGDTTWTFVPTIQCSVSSDGEYAVIAGEAADDPEVEISLDIRPDGQRFDVTIDDQGLFALGDALTASVEGGTVSGTATLSDGPSTREASFELTCG